MNSKLARTLTRLYPRSWRDRYAEEFQALLQSDPGSHSLLSTTADILCAALNERMRPMPLPKGATSMPQNADAAQHWTNRAPWAVFTLTPVALLAAAYLAACLILWSGWKIFLPQTSTPFVRVYGAAVLYFGVGRALYYSAPLVIGWGVALLAAKRQIEATWPAIGLVSTALMAAAAQVYADQPIPGHGGSIGINLALSNPGTLTRAFILFAITALPYLIWRIKGRPVNHPPAV